MVLMYGVPRAQEQAMAPFNPRFSFHLRVVLMANIFFGLLACAPRLLAAPAYVRVNQAGYEAGNGPFRAYLMSSTTATGAAFQVINSKGAIAHSGQVGALLGVWAHTK